MSIPSWQIAALQQLSAQGQLSGLPPSMLASIDQAESSGEVAGAGVNSSGYGGYFGLGAGASYPGGSVPASTLETNSAPSFATQAEVAASELASLITQNAGNVQAAIGAYDGGGPSGGFDYQVYAGNGGAPTASASPSSATLTGLNFDPFDLFGIPQTIGGSVASGVWASVGPFMVKAILVIAGLSMIVAGAIKMASPGKSIRQITANLPSSSGGSPASSGAGVADDLPALAAA